ncbi:MAG: flagellar protein FlaG [Spirochaetales bacterium]|nr:flagellar protein FlaG [Spirochaetales bacterium]MCF7937562.1 flagellar protein FlaG [Spirochaetales bacterium]
MALEIPGLSNIAASQETGRKVRSDTDASRRSSDIQEHTQSVRDNIRQNAEENSRRTEEQLNETIREIQKYAQTFNKRLKFSVNDELERVIVKVVDGNTDKVIKEIPPEALQRVLLRIREAIGILFDTTI